jgi:ribonuclease J
MLRLAPGIAQIIDETPAGRVHLDGRILVEAGAGLAHARRAMAFAGLIAITVVLDGKDRAATEPAILIEGIPLPVHDAVRRAVEEAIGRYNPKRDDEADLKENVRRAARRAASDAWGKKPVTRVEVIRL